MSIPSTIKYNSYDHLRSMEYEQSESTYICDCGQEYMNEETLRRHQQMNCKNRSIKCSFCPETFSSSNLLRDHLLLCGNKTDECPHCHQLIRRSHFTYHYENKCAPIDEIETPPTRIKSRLTQHIPTNSNMPVSRVDVPSNGYDLDYSGQNPSANSPAGNSRNVLRLLNQNDQSLIIECEYCHNRCTRNDYINHKNNCLQNPANTNRKRSVAIPLRSNHSQSSSHGIVHIPCEICDELIDLPNWSNHTQNCREREKQRLVKRAETMSQEPVMEQLPCEHCHQLFSAKQLYRHQGDCGKNAINIESIHKLPQPRRVSPTITLPVKKSNNQSNRTKFRGRSPHDPRFAQYQSIDIDLTRAANRSAENNKNTNQHYIEDTANDDNHSQSENYQRRGRSYDNVSIRSNEELSPSPKRGSPNAISRRARSSDNLIHAYDNQPLSNNSNNYRTGPYHNSRSPTGNPQRNDQLSLMEERRDHTKTGKKKKSWFKELFGCATKTRGVD